MSKYGSAGVVCLIALGIILAIVVECKGALESLARVEAL